jgi:hypothetical protein
VLEEAAYVEPGFFYETVAPLLLIGNTSLLAISTLTSEINFYTRLLRMRDKVTGLPLFTSISVQLACRKCIEDGRAAACVHMLHLVPRWQSSDRHVKLKTIMQVLDQTTAQGRTRADRNIFGRAQDRPDLIESELSGLAFDSNQQIFKTAHIETMFNQPPPPAILNEAVYTFIDPAAGGPQSDYAVLSVTRHKGLLTVSQQHRPRILAAQVRLPQRVHKRLVRHPAVLDPPRHQLLAQGVVEPLRLVRAERAHQQHPRLPLLLDAPQVPPHRLVLVEQHEELDLQPVQRVPLPRPQELQRLRHALPRPVLARHVDHRLLDQPRDEGRVRPVQHV